MRSRTPSLLILTLVFSSGGCGKEAPTGPSSTTSKAATSVTIEPLEAVKLDGSGSTFINPIMKFWTEQFLERTGKKVEINYQGGGSGAGITAVTKKEVAYGCTDAPLTAEQLEEAKQSGGEVLHIPLVIGAVVPMYNLPNVEAPVIFTGSVLAEIFTGKITRWNDQKLASLNPGVTLPDMGIQPVYRADKSGTSFIFTDYLSKVDPEFKKTVGAKTLPTWPTSVGIGQQKSEGVAGHIDRTPGAIGYIELTYALDKKAKYGKVRNKAGKDVLGDFDSTVAAAAASLGEKQTEAPYSLHEFTYNLTNAAGEKSYPIAGMTFAVVYKKLSGEKAGGAKGKAVIAFLKWATSSEGQELAKKRNFAPIPADLQQKIAAKLDTVTVE